MHHFVEQNSVIKAIVKSEELQNKSLRVSINNNHTTVIDACYFALYPRALIIGAIRSSPTYRR